MGFDISVYSIDRTLPEQYIRKDLEIFNKGDITPGIYKKRTEFWVDCKSIEEIEKAVEQKIKLEESDIVEWQIDGEALRNPSKELAELMRIECNYFIMTVFGLEQIAIEKEKVFVDLTLQEIAKQFRE